MGRIAVGLIVSSWAIPISIFVNHIVPEPYMVIISTEISFTTLISMPICVCKDKLTNGNLCGLWVCRMRYSTCGRLNSIAEATSKVGIP